METPGGKLEHSFQKIRIMSPVVFPGALAWAGLSVVSCGAASAVVAKLHGGGGGGGEDTTTTTATPSSSSSSSKQQQKFTAPRNRTHHNHHQGHSGDGERLLWQTVRWDDGAIYRGLSKREMCHGLGSFEYPNGDTYEGAYDMNQMEGFGIYTWKNGSSFAGRWHDSKMHGCGVLTTVNQGGGVPSSHRHHGGEWKNDEFVGVNTKVCHRAAMDGAVQEANDFASKARKLARLAELREMKHERQRHH